MNAVNLVASFWSMHAGGTWPPIAVVFLVVVAFLIGQAWRQHVTEKREAYHYHRDVDGVLVKCYHACKQQNLIFSRMYWLSLTFAFPIEHIVYHKLWPFYLLSNWLNVG